MYVCMYIYMYVYVYVKEFGQDYLNLASKIGREFDEDIANRHLRKLLENLGREIENKCEEIKISTKSKSWSSSNIHNQLS